MLFLILARYVISSLCEIHSLLWPIIYFFIIMANYFFYLGFINANIFLHVRSFAD